MPDVVLTTSGPCGCCNAAPAACDYECRSKSGPSYDPGEDVNDPFTRIVDDGTYAAANYDDPPSCTASLDYPSPYPTVIPDWRLPEYNVTLTGLSIGSCYQWYLLAEWREIGSNTWSTDTIVPMLPLFIIFDENNEIMANSNTYNTGWLLPPMDDTYTLLGFPGNGENIEVRPIACQVTLIECS